MLVGIWAGKGGCIEGSPLHGRHVDEKSGKSDLKQGEEKIYIKRKRTEGQGME